MFGTLSSRLFDALPWLEQVWNAWLVVVGAFSWVVARVVSVVAFVVVFTPYGLVMRLVGFDPLNRGFDETRESYWMEPEATTTTMDDFEKQY